jgi:hypothetical protein
MIYDASQFLKVDFPVRKRGNNQRLGGNLGTLREI